MTWQISQGFLSVNFDPAFTSAIASMLFIFGLWARINFGLLRRFCVPAGVVGGLCMSMIVFSLYLPRIALINFDLTLQMPLISIFFTRVGLTGSIQLLRRGGKVLVIYMCCCWGLVIFQNVLGVFMANVFDLHPVLGIMAGAVSLQGGHNLAGIFGPMAESMGVHGAHAVAVAAATFGLISGGTLGAPLADWLIRSRKLELVTSYDALYKGYHNREEKENIEVHDFVHTLGMLLTIMALGQWGAGRFQAWCVETLEWENFVFPGYLGAMLLAVFFRNVNDVLKIARMHTKSLDLISTVSVSLFLTISMMNLKIWELRGLALPLVIMLLVQTLAILVFTVASLFPLMAGDYDAAVMCSGFVGHGLGAPPSAVSMMRAVCDQYNVMSYKAFLIVPLCGAVLIDLVALPSIIWFIQYYAR